MSSLFREEVLDSEQKHSMGQVVLIQPLSHTLMASLAFLILSTLCAAMVFCKYTRKTEVGGVLEPAGGVIKLYAPQNGRLKMSYIHQGQFVHKGDVLLLFASDRGLATGQVMEENEELQLRNRIKLIDKEWQQTRLLHRSDVELSRQTLENLRNSQSNLLEQIQVQMKRVQLAEDSLARLQELQRSGFIPELQIHTKRDEFLDQQLRLKSMQSQKISNDAEIAKLSRSLAAEPAREAVSDAQLSRNMSSAETELNQYSGNHQWSLIAPCDGIVTAFSISKNQLASIGVPLITIVPNNSVLQATLYSPSKALGFVMPGKKVRMKLDAYPYQQFGMINGTIDAIAGTPVQLSEIAPSARLLPSGMTDEPAYSIRVTLDQQTIRAYGMPRPLKAGIQVSAEIELDTRRLYKWILEPLYNR